MNKQKAIVVYNMLKEFLAKNQDYQYLSNYQFQNSEVTKNFFEHDSEEDCFVKWLSTIPVDVPLEKVEKHVIATMGALVAMDMALSKWKAASYKFSVLGFTDLEFSMCTADPKDLCMACVLTNKRNYVGLIIGIVPNYSPNELNLMSRRVALVASQKNSGSNPFVQARPLKTLQASDIQKFLDAYEKA